jgi:dienelactone hydrolase
VWPRRLVFSPAGRPEVPKIALFSILSFVFHHALGQVPTTLPTQLAAPGPTGARVNSGGILGNLYPAQGDGQHAAILLVGGSDGGISHLTNLDAIALQSSGFTVLALSYFRGPGQPEALFEIPLETFDRALDWLRAHASVDPAKLGMVGFSKGAEATLLMASRRSDIRAVVAGSPSSVVWPGINWARWGAVAQSSWSVAGRPLQPLPYGKFSITGGMRSIFEAGLKQLELHPESVIPVERIGVPVMLVCGGADQVWPSCEMARQIQARVATGQGPAVSLLEYPQADHGAFGSPALEPRRFGPGAESDASRQAREDSWPLVVRFLKETLR